MNIYQHLDELKDSDGVGNDAIGLHKQFLKLGWKSDFITRISRKGKNLENTKFYNYLDQIKFKSNDIHILHYGGHGYPLENFQLAPGKKILRFHNVTPSTFYKETTTEEIYASMHRFESMSYLELSSLAIYIDSAWCDSPYNAYTIKSLDYRNLGVLPICKKYEDIADRSDLPSNMNICFVGRYAPQKKWEDLIHFFAVWKKKHQQAMLFCVGSIIGAFDGYFKKLENLVKNLGLEDSIFFKTNLTDEEVVEVMEKSSAFVSMSEHEGFCLPLLEAFGVAIPVFAFDACAVKSTMKDGGFLFQEKDYTQLTNTITDIISNKTKITDLIKNQKKVLRYYNDFPWESVLPKLIEQI